MVDLSIVRLIYQRVSHRPAIFVAFSKSAVEVLLLSPYIGGDTVKKLGRKSTGDFF